MAEFQALKPVQMFIRPIILADNVLEDLSVANTKRHDLLFQPLQGILNVVTHTDIFLNGVVFVCRNVNGLITAFS